MERLGYLVIGHVRVAFNHAQNGAAIPFAAFGEFLDWIVAVPPIGYDELQHGSWWPVWAINQDQEVIAYVRVTKGLVLGSD